MPMRLTGKPSMAYRGVEAVTPPNIVESVTVPSKGIVARPPTINDYHEYNEGDLWMVKRDPALAIPNELWYLARKTGTALGLEAHWRQLYPQAGGGGGGNLRCDIAYGGLIAIPDPLNGAINVFGGEPYLGNPQYINMYTTRPDLYTIDVNLKRSIFQPNTNAAGDEGLYSLGEHDFLHNFGTDNTACGGDALNRNLDILTAVSNTACGHEALHSIGTGPRNSALGSGALADLIGGGHNIGIGYDAGGVFNLNESSNIIIGNSLGTIGDNNTIRIGSMPIPPLDPFGVPTPPGDAQQDKCYIAGIWNGVAHVPALDTGLVIVDEEGKLYVDNLAPNSCVFTDAGGNPIAVKGPVGTVLTGHGILAGDPPPEFLPLVSPDLSIVIGVDPITGGINLTAAPAGGGVSQFTTDDANVVLPDPAHNVNVFGIDLLHTVGAVANTIQIGITQGNDDEVIGGNTGASPSWKQLQSTDGSINIIPGPAGIDFKVVGIAPPAGINYLMDHAGLHVLPIANGIQIEQGDNIETIGDIATAKITVRVTDSVELPNGHMYARDNIETTAGHFIADAGYLRLPDTAPNMGDIRFRVGLGDQIYFHKYGVDNVFIGRASGNLALIPANAFNNTCCGSGTGGALTTGQRNSAYGYGAMRDNTIGNQNTCVGEGAMIQSTTSNYNCCIGYHAGFSLLAGTVNNSNMYIEHPGYNAESNTIRIGQHGVASHHHSHCYVAGIYGSTEGANAKMVVCSQVVTGGVTDYKLSTQDIPDAGAIQFNADAGHAHPAGGILNIVGDENINTSAAGNTVTVKLDHSVIQPITNAAGTDGVYSLSAAPAAKTYLADRFLHAWGGGLGMGGYNTFVGYQSGRLSALAIGASNTVVGAMALDAYTTASNNVAIGKNAMGVVTTASSNTIVGTSAGSALTTGGNNIFLGASSGTAYTNETYNIMLGNPGVAADTRTMRLGYTQVWGVPAPDPHNPDPVETLITHGTDNTYCYGIYKNTVAYSGTPVYVDHLGKLGTEGGVAFSTHLVNSLASVTGDGTVFTFGTSLIPTGGFTKDFDNTNSLTLGNGAGVKMFFTAPYSGKYVFTASITYNVPAAPPPPQPPQSPLYLVTSNLSYCFTTYIPLAIVGTAQQASEIVTAFVYLDAGDTVFWACQVSGTTKTIGILNYRAPVIGPLVPICNATYFTGYRMA